MNEMPWTRWVIPATRLNVCNCLPSSVSGFILFPNPLYRIFHSTQLPRPTYCFKAIFSSEISSKWCLTTSPIETIEMRCPWASTTGTWRNFSSAIVCMMSATLASTRFCTLASAVIVSRPFRPIVFEFLMLFFNLQDE